MKYQFNIEKIIQVIITNTLATLFIIGTVHAAVTLNAGLTSSGGLTVSAGAISLPATSIADAALSGNVTLLGNTFNITNTLVKLDGSGKLPALDGSALTVLTATNVSGTIAIVNGGTGGTNSSTARVNLGLAIGTNVQAWSLNLDSWSTIATSSALNILLPSQISNAGKFLTTDGTSTSWSATGGGTGTVTSVESSGGTTGLTLSGGPITTTGTLTLGGTLAIANGGTGATNSSTARANLGAAALGSYAMFYGLTAGTGMSGTDYAATVAAGGAVPFPQNGPTFGGIVAISSTAFKIPTIGTYEVTFHVHTIEPGQLELTVDNGVGFVVAHECTGENFNPTAGGHPIVANCIITTTGADAIVEVINPAGNSTALTITPADGANTNANSQTLVIKQLQ